MASTHDVSHSGLPLAHGMYASSTAAALDPFLEPGPMNRLYLSLRSGIPSQVDWALDRLAAYTYEMPDRFLLADYPGMADSLASFMLCLCLAVRGLPRSEWDTMQRAYNVNGTLVDQGIGGSEYGYSGIAATSVKLAHLTLPTAVVGTKSAFQPRAHARDAAILRRAMEAVLVLRNLALSPANLTTLVQIPYILDVLHDSLALEDHLDECVDIRPNVLDMLECIASRLVLSDWVRQKYVLGMAVHPPHFVEDRIFVMLHEWIHTSNDRALLLGALRCCRAFASNMSNASALAEIDLHFHETSLGLVSRCISLLPLTQDPELLEAVLDLLYQLLSIDDNVMLLGACRTAQASTRIQAIVRYLVRNLNLGKSVWERDSPSTANQHAWWAGHIPNTQRIRQIREVELREKMSPMERHRWRVLPPEIQARIEMMPEPERGTAWMKTLFEHDSDGEVTQMEFWIAYRDQFTPLANAGGPPLQPAANLIRHVSQTFPGAAAMVISADAGAQPRFVIRGIAPRLRESRGPVCLWVGCSSPHVHTWAQIREHYDAHTQQASDGLCRCLGCAYVALSDDEDEQRKQLRMHVSTHLPPTRDANVFVAPSAPPATGTHERPGLIQFEVERTPSVPTHMVGQPPTPCGVAFLSLLILRYITRVSSSVLRRDGYGCPNYVYGGAVASTKRPAEREEYFGFPLSSLTEDSQAQNDARASSLDEEYAQAAEQIMYAMAGIEDVLVETSLRNDILCRLANDTLVALRPVED